MQSFIYKPTLPSGGSGAPLYCFRKVGEYIYMYNLPHHQGKAVHSKGGTGHSITAEWTTDDWIRGTSCNIIQSRYVYLDWWDGLWPRNSKWKYGYSLRDITPCVCQLHVSGRRISAIPVLTTRGIEDLYLISGSVNGDVFEDFICQCVLPILLPYDGQNPGSVVFLDNASIHRLDRVHTYSMQTPVCIVSSQIPNCYSNLHLVVLHEKIVLVKHAGYM